MFLKKSKTIGTVWSILRTGSSLVKGRRMDEVVLEGLSKCTILCQLITYTIFWVGEFSALCHSPTNCLPFYLPVSFLLSTTLDIQWGISSQWDWLHKFVGPHAKWKCRVPCLKIIEDFKMTRGQAWGPSKCRTPSDCMKPACLPASQFLPRLCPDTLRNMRLGEIALYWEPGTLRSHTAALWFQPRFLFTLSISLWVERTHLSMCYLRGNFI